MKKRVLRKNKKERDNPFGLAIPAGLFLGMGIGFLTGKLVAGLFIGLGTGFFVMLLATLLIKKKSKR